MFVVGIGVLYFYYQYRQPRFIAGEKVPDFTTVLANSQEVSLSDLRGKYVLLQFWGSWCGPCRAENRHLTRLYQRYHQQGFEIFSIAIEKNQASWERAIASDQLTWPYHALELSYFNGPLATQFNIHSIPATYLINPEGTIMGVNLSPDQIDKKLAGSLTSR